MKASEQQNRGEAQGIWTLLIFFFSKIKTFIDYFCENLKE